MRFPKDILLIDFEGLHVPKQIGAILLDKNTLEEKDSFSSYIYANMVDKIEKLISGITQEMLEGALSQAEVGKIVFDKFGTDILIASFVADLDFRHFKTIISSAGIDPTLYDYHILDIWPLAYVHLLKGGYTGKINSEEIFQAFGAKPRGLHDALEDCRITADVLRKIVQ
ncbi:MAG: exonuclease domain-containing protein [Patescibacteria group bacterium]